MKLKLERNLRHAKFNYWSGVGRWAQVVEHLLGKCEALSLIPSAAKKKKEKQKECGNLVLLYQL
jgi:hypothetical protein